MLDPDDERNGEGWIMKSRRGLVLVTLVTAGLAGGCSGGSQADSGSGLGTLPSGPTTTGTASPTPTKVDPTAAASAQVTAAVRNYVTVLMRGALANDPRFDYSTIATGKKLEEIRQGFTNQYVMGNRFSGTATIRAIKVESIILRGRSSSAVATGCVDDRAVLTNKKTKKIVGKIGGESSWTFTMVRKESRWVTSDVKSVAKDTGACTRP
jgi:hypothetical protein